MTIVALLASGPLVAAGLSSLRLAAAPSATAPLESGADAADFYALGGMADGVLHPLSGVTTFGGRDTTGYTLARWRSLFADMADKAGNNPVMALSDTIDEVAVQALVNKVSKVPTGVASVSLPAGLIMETRPLRSGCSPITVRGAGLYATQIQQTVSGQDGWHHGTPDTGCPNRYGAKLSIEDLTFTAARFGGTAVIVSQNPATSGFHMRSVQVLGGDPNFFHDGIRCIGCSDFSAYNVTLQGNLSGRMALAGTGLFLGGVGADGYNWFGGLIGGYSRCIVSNTGMAGRVVNGDIEGVVFQGLNTGDCGTVFTTGYDNVKPIVSTPQFYILGGQYGNIHTAFLELDATGDVFVQDNLTYSTTPFAVGSGDLLVGRTIVGNLRGAVPKVGDYVSGALDIIPAETTVVSVDGTTSYRLSKAPTKTRTAMSPEGQLSLSYQPVSPFTAQTTLHSAKLTSVSAFSPETEIGGTVVGPGIPPEDVIVAADEKDGTVTLALPATTTASGAKLAFRYHHAAPFVSMRNLTNVAFKNNAEEFGPGNNVASLLSIGKSRNLGISGNVFDDLGNVMTAGFVDEGGNSTLTEKDDTFGPFWGANGTAKTVSAPFASHTKSVRWGAYYTGLGCDLGTSGQVTCTGSFVGPLSSQHDLSVPLPPAFLEPPLVMAINGNIGVSTAVCGKKNTVTTAAFTAACSAGTPGVKVQIDYMARGF